MQDHRRTHEHCLYFNNVTLPSEPHDTTEALHFGLMARVQIAVHLEQVVHAPAEGASRLTIGQAVEVAQVAQQRACAADERLHMSGARSRSAVHLG